MENRISSHPASVSTNRGPVPGNAVDGLLRDEFVKKSSALSSRKSAWMR